MPNHASLTYGQLYKKLRELGFQEYSVDLDGKRGRVFEQEGVAGSMIVLPERDPNTLVEPFSLQPVLLTLRRLNLLPETNPLAT
jgi:hypothetical protein